MLDNTGTIGTTVDARFDTGAGGIFGLIGGSNLLRLPTSLLKNRFSVNGHRCHMTGQMPGL